MGTWSKLALLAAGALAGSIATRVAADPQRRAAVAKALDAAREPSTESALTRRSGSALSTRSRAARSVLVRATSSARDFVARVRAGMAERETELREQFGVRAPVDHTAGPVVGTRVVTEVPGAPPHDALPTAAPSTTNPKPMEEGNER